MLLYLLLTPRQDPTKKIVSITTSLLFYGNPILVLFITTVKSGNSRIKFVCICLTRIEVVSNPVGMNPEPVTSVLQRICLGLGNRRYSFPTSFPGIFDVL